MESMVTSPDHQGIDYKLRLVRSDPTFENPKQLWEFVTDYAVSHTIRLSFYQRKHNPAQNLVGRVQNINKIEHSDILNSIFGSNTLLCHNAGSHGQK